jgi:2-oxoglutarate ferredoxin oxidoreductase subunit alpha
MAGTSVAEQETQSRPAADLIVNDFAIQVATVNGSGSQTANLVLLRSIFQMGIPVSGKNMFPSNIAGLPTWYTVRASAKGYIGRKKEVDLLVAMNAETAREDVMTLAPGAAVVYDEPLKLNELRTDLVFYPVPFDKLIAPVTTDAKLRRLVRNMIYDGVLAKLLSIDTAQMEKALRKQLGKKQKAIDLNMAALKSGFDYAETNLPKRDRLKVEPMTGKTEGKILIEGNNAAAIGCMMAGVTFIGWYPITPSSSLCETLIDYLKKYRKDPASGKATYAVVQAEDEIAALGMVLGAGWMGARSMTSTAGPGVSLMAEFTGLGYYAEVPAVIFDVQRAGPSTGLPTRTGQQDIKTALLSHGDTKHPLLLPASVSECYEMAMSAFDLAERMQTPVFVMTDLDLGMNTWMSDPFVYNDKPFDRGKRLDAETLKKIGEWGRYKDVDGDGIPYRSVPGDGMPAFFTRGSGHNEKALYSERSDDYENNLNRLARKFDTARTLVPKPEVTGKGKVGIIAYGTTHWSLVESLDQLRNENKLETSYMRVKAFPFTQEVFDFIDAHERVYVIDQNRDGQLWSLLKIELNAEQVAKTRSIRQYSGLPLDARTLTNAILKQEGN